MKADRFMKIFFIVIMTISFGIPSATEIVDSPLLKEIAQKKAMLFKKPNASKNVVILRRKPIQSEPIKPEPIKNATQPSNRPRIVNVKGSDGELRSYRLVPVTSEDSETKTTTEAPIKKENGRTKMRTKRIKETPTKDRAFIPPYKFPMWGNPYGIYSNAGFINPGLFPFVPGGPGFPPYDGIFGGPFGPGMYPGNPGNPFPSPPPPGPGGNNRPPYDIPATLAALGYAQPPGQPPLNPTGPPPGAFSPGSPTGVKRSSTERPPKSSSLRTTTTRAKQKPKPKPRPADSGSHSSDGGCSCGKGPEAPVYSRPRTTTPAPSPPCPCASGKYPAENSHDKYKSDMDDETKSPPPCPYSKQENSENKHKEISDSMTHASYPTPPPPTPTTTATPSTTTQAPYRSSPPCDLQHMPHESSSPQEKPRPASQPCPLKHVHENSITTTELPHTTQPMYPPQQQMVMPPPPREQVVASPPPPPPPPMVVTSPHGAYTSTASPQMQHSTGASPQPNTIVYKPTAQEIIHGPTSITVPLPFPFTMDSNGRLQPQHQSHSPGSEVTYKLDLNSDLLTKISTPVVMTQPQQQPFQYQGNQYPANGLPFKIAPPPPPPPPQSYYSQPYHQPRSRVMVVDKMPKGQFSQPPSMYQVEAPQHSVVDWQPDPTYDQQSLSPMPHPMSVLNRILNQAKPLRNSAGNLHSSDRFDVRTPLAHSSYGDFSSSEHGESEESHVPSTRRRFSGSNAKSNKNPKHDFVIIDRAELEELKRSSTTRNTNNNYIPTPEKNLPPPADIIHIKLHTDNNEKENVNKPLSFPDSRYYNHNYANDNAQRKLQRVDQAADVPSHSHFPNTFNGNKNFRSSGRKKSSSKRNGIRTRKPAYYY